MTRTLTPPFDFEGALAKIQNLQVLWNTHNPALIADAFSQDSQWHHEDKCLNGLLHIRTALEEKSQRELHYRFNAQLWTHSFSRFSQRIVFEWQDSVNGQWYRTRGNEQLQFDAAGLIRELDSCTVNIPIAASERQLLFVSD